MSEDELDDELKMDEQLWASFLGEEELRKKNVDFDDAELRTFEGLCAEVRSDAEKAMKPVRKKAMNYYFGLVGRKVENADAKRAVVRLIENLMHSIRFQIICELKTCRKPARLRVIEKPDGRSYFIYAHKNGQTHGAGQRVPDFHFQPEPPPGEDS